jgi:RNA polymerase sigma-B factor
LCVPHRTASTPHRTHRLLVTYHRTRDPDAREALVHRFLPYARRLAWRYHTHGQPIDDLSQIAAIGLLKAIDRFDPSLGTEFMSFAKPTITGELKRYFRDFGWVVRVPRGLQELALEVNRASYALERELGHPPTAAQLAERMGTPADRVQAAHDVLRARFGVSLEGLSDDRDDEGRVPGELIGTTDGGFGRVEDGVSLDTLMGALGDREREILHLRFSEDLTQSDIATRMGVSQMQVSRAIRGAMKQLGEAPGAGALR